MPKRFHLAWFTNFTAGDWTGTFSHGGTPWDGKFYIEMAQALERACFDYVIYEDKLLVPEAHRGSAETTLKLALTPANLTALVVVRFLPMIVRARMFGT